MNRFTRRIAIMRERLSESLLHIGWGFMGQECECNAVWPNMNWLARRTIKTANDWDDVNDRPKTLRGRMLVWVGDVFCNAGTRLINGKLMNAYYNEQRVLSIKANAIEGALRDAADKAKDVTPKKRKRRNKKNVRLTRSQQAELHAMWRNGSSVAACSRKFKVSYPTARKYVKLLEQEKFAIETAKQMLRAV